MATAREREGILVSGISAREGVSRSDAHNAMGIRGGGKKGGKYKVFLHSHTFIECLLHTMPCAR